MNKILLHASVASMLYKFNLDNIDILQNIGFDVEIACDFGNDNPMSFDEINDFKKKLNKKNIKYYDVICPRSIFKISKIYKGYKQLLEISNNNYSVVHTQSPIGGVICRLAFKNKRKNGLKIIYQAHGFHFYKGASLLNWLIFYPIEKFCSKYTDILITINSEDFLLAKNKFHMNKIEYVPGVGVDVNKFEFLDKVDILKSELNIGKDYFVFLSIGELNENKNHIVVLKALKKLLENDCDKWKYIICGEGNQRKKIDEFIRNNRLSENVYLAGYRTDVNRFYGIADAFIFPSFREGLSVSLMEAMACGLPCIVSNIRGNVDLIDESGGVLFNPFDYESCFNAIEKIINCDEIEKMKKHNVSKIMSFDKSNVSLIMEQIYRSCLK